MLYKLRKWMFGSKLERSIKNKDEWYHQFLDWCHEKYTDFIIVPHETICRFFYWGWKLRKNYSWEAYSVYYIIHLKLKKLINYSRKYGHLVWNHNNENSKEFRKLKIACELARRIYAEDYSTNYDNHRIKWGDTSWNSKSTKEVIEFRKAIELDELKKKNEIKYLYELLEKHLERWWD